MSEDLGEIAELRKEFSEERTRVDDTMKQLLDLHRELTQKISQWQLGIEHSIGRLEGKLENLASTDKPTADQTAATVRSAS